MTAEYARALRLADELHALGLAASARGLGETSTTFWAAESLALKAFGIERELEVTC